MRKTFVSKQNQVTLLTDLDEIFALKESHGEDIQSSIIKKEFNCPQKYKKEVFIGDILRCSSHILTPKKVFCEEPKVIYYEYIKGITATDFLESLEKEDDQEASYEIITGIVDWLKNFYLYMESYTGDKWILGDIHLRNFIVAYDDKGFQRIYGIDFEDCKRGIWEQDIARLSAFMITYTPAFTEFKLKLTKKFITLISEKLILDKEDIRKILMEELRLIEKRRDIQVFYHLIDDLI